MKTLMTLVLATGALLGVQALTAKPAEAFGWCGGSCCRAAVLLSPSRVRLPALQGRAPLSPEALLSVIEQLTAKRPIGVGLSGLSALAVWRAAPRKVRVVAGQMHRLRASSA